MALAEVSTSTSTRDTIIRNVKTLMALNGLEGRELAPKIGLTATQLSRRLTSNPNPEAQSKWTAEDVDRLAKFFEVPASLFYEAPEEMMRRLSAFGYRLTDLEVLATEGDLQQSLPFRPPLTVVD